MAFPTCNSEAASPTRIRLPPLRGLVVSSFQSRWYETFGMSIAEAFACGTPVICSAVGGDAGIGR